MKRYYMLETNDADKSAELYIFGDITSYPWYEDGVSAYGLVKQLQDMDVEHIKVHINSYGGEVKEGLAIYNALKDSKMKVTTICDGFACSAASVVFMAGDERIIKEASLLMIHNAWTFVQGDSNALRKQADDLEKIAQATAGCVGADLANLVNEAALRAVRKGRKLVTQEDMLAAFEFVIAGSEKKNSVLTEFEKKLVAYHEVGHAMVAYKQKNAEPVQKITIVPHTEGSLGYTLLMPEEDKTNLRTRDELMAKIAVSMGGRAAEEVVMNTMTNGASQDIQEATGIARNMVAMYGMSDEIGMVALGSVRNQYLDGGYGLDCAQDTAAIMDREVKGILDKCYAAAVQVIRDNREDMDKVVAYLLEKETITGGEMVAILEGRDPSTVEEAYASTRTGDEGFRPSQPSVIEAPARHISMTSEKIEMPQDKGEETSTGEKPPAEPEAPADEPKGETKDAPSGEESK